MILILLKNQYGSITTQNKEALMRNRFLTGGTKHRDVSAALATLKGVVSIQEIIDAIRSIDNFHTKTLKGITQSFVEKVPNGISLSELYVDMTYQRRIRLAKIINKLRKHGGFSQDGAGTIDVAERPDGKKYVWDGFRRCLKAGICGRTHISHTKYIHPPNYTMSRCRKAEAKLYKMRNAESEKMSFDEIFKSMVVYDDAQALEILELLNNCDLDVEGLVDSNTAKTLGGLKCFWDNSFKRGLNIDSDYFIQSSRILNKIFQDDPSISAYALVGLAWLLHQNTECDDVTSSYSEEEIFDALNEYIHPSNGHSLKQTILTSQRVNGKNAQSVAYHIAKNALDDTNGLMNAVIDIQDAELIEALA